jgi:hypothetical protein
MALYVTVFVVGLAIQIVTRSIEYARTKAGSRMAVPIGLRLRRSATTRLRDSALLATVCSGLAAVAAGLGFPRIAGTLLSVAIVLLGLSHVAPLLGVEITSLTFERAGLRVCLHSSCFVVPWTAITRVDVRGSRRSQRVDLLVQEPHRILATMTPVSRFARIRVRAFAFDSENQLELEPALWGFDAQVFARAIDRGIRGELGRAN